jgi:hypothetical protein
MMNLYFITYLYSLKKEIARSLFIIHSASLIAIENIYRKKARIRFH